MDSDILLLLLTQHLHVPTILFTFLKGTDYLQIINGETEAERG